MDWREQLAQDAADLYQKGGEAWSRAAEALAPNWGQELLAARDQISQVFTLNMRTFEQFPQSSWPRGWGRDPEQPLGPQHEHTQEQEKDLGQER